MDKIKAFGHKSPDTDSTLAPIVYSWYQKQLGVEVIPHVLGEPNKEALFVLGKFKVDKPEILTDINPNDEIVILDTSNPDELPEGINKAEILEIVDHHKLAGGLSTPAPIKITVRPVACTMTILYELVERDGLLDKLPNDIAGLMLAAILSDTLLFTSPTTTDRDKEVSERLEKITGIDMKELAEEMFDAKSDLTGMSASMILLSDSKIYELACKKVRVAVLETTKPENALNMKEELFRSNG